MRKQFILLVVVTTSTAIFSAYAIFNMITQCQTPFYIECIGTKLDPKFVYGISNKPPSLGSDTIHFNFLHSKLLFPTTLGHLMYNTQKAAFEFKNKESIQTGEQKNYFLPFATTLYTKWHERAIFFGPNSIVDEGILINYGIKWNIPAGSISDRVSLKLFRNKNNVYATIKDDGIGVKYLVKAKEKNIYDIFINQPAVSENPLNFHFDNTSTYNGKFSIEISPTSSFSCTASAKDEQGKLLYNGEGSTQYIEISNFIFKIWPKYPKSFYVAYCSFIVILFAFQCFFIRKAYFADNPIIFSLFSLRVFLNSLVYIGTPIFITAYYLGYNKGLFPVLILALNLTFFIPKWHFESRKPFIKLQYIYTLLIIIVMVAPVLLKIFTRSENLFGIPILHVQKVLILLVAYLVAQKQEGYYKWISLCIILSYSLVLSLVSSDFSSFLYISLAMLLIFLIKKYIKLKTAAILIAMFAVFLTALFMAIPEKITTGKGYRLFAPYTTPQNYNLNYAEQGDRETYAYLMQMFKTSFSERDFPKFNQFIVPPVMRTVFHTDYAVFSGAMLSGYVYLGSLLFLFLLISRELFLLLLFSTRPVRVNTMLTYKLPWTKEGELLSILLAITSIQFIYPVFSNCLLLPITGQNIPIYQISNGEIIMIMLLLWGVESIFTNKKYYSLNPYYDYTYKDARKSLQYGLFMLAIFFIILFIIRLMSFSRMPQDFSWKKAPPINSKLELPNISNPQNKQALIDTANHHMKEYDFKRIPNRNRTLLKELTSLYYSNIPYSKTIYSSKHFSLSSNQIMRVVSLDSQFQVSKKLVSGELAPYGKVFMIENKVNDKVQAIPSHPLYWNVSALTPTINADLTAELNDKLQVHIKKIGNPNTIGAIWVIDHHSGRVSCHSSYPFNSQVNSADIYALPGSVKKMLISYAALTIDPGFKDSLFFSKRFGRKISFREFIQWSDNDYAGHLLRHLYLKKPDKLEKVLEDFDLPLHSSLTQDGYFDVVPEHREFSKEMNRHSMLYRVAIGQEKPYAFRDVIEWYVKFAATQKVTPNYNLNAKKYPKLSISDSEIGYLHEVFNSPLYGTASNVAKALLANNYQVKDFYCKTGTAARQDGNGNASSTFIIWNSKNLVAIQLSGWVPNNDKGLSAKDLFTNILPLLGKYNVFGVDRFDLQ